MTRTKQILPIAVALLAAAATPVLADEAEEKEPGWWLPGEFNGSASVTNNYVFRGITQTDDNPAIQGSIGYALDTGFEGISAYGSVWGSNIDFNDGDHAQVELDWSFGFTGEIADTGLGWTLGAIYYTYPGARSNSNFDYWEFAPALSYNPIDPLTLTFGLNYSPDYFAASGDGYYLNGGAKYDIPIPDNWFTLALAGYTGHQWIEHNNNFGTDDYQDWKLGLEVGIKSITLGAYYTDTNLNKNNCFGGSGDCGPRAVLSLTAAF
jgi:uncharacterized protein (TIGR02001 family)